MSSYIQLVNNLEQLKLTKIKEYIPNYLDDNIKNNLMIFLVHFCYIAPKTSDVDIIVLISFAFCGLFNLLFNAFKLIIPR